MYCESKPFTFKESGRLRLGTEESSCQKHKKLCQTADLKPKQVHIEGKIEIETQIYPGHFNKNRLRTC